MQDDDVRGFERAFEPADPPEQSAVDDPPEVTPPASAEPDAQEPAQEVPFEEGAIGEQGDWHEDALKATGADDSDDQDGEDT